MSNAYILNEKLESEQKIKVEETLSKHGINTRWVLPTDLSTIDARQDVGVICLPLNLEEAAEVTSKMKSLVASGVRVICIWLSQGELPSGAEKFGSAAVGIDSDSLGAALKGEPVWEESDGKSRPHQSVPRNKCQ